MKVYILYYDWFDDSEIRGVYSEESMRAELVRYTEVGRKINNAEIARRKSLVEKNKNLRTQYRADKKDVERQLEELTNKVTLTIDEAQKLSNLQRKLKIINRKIGIATRSINMDNEKIKKLNQMTDEQLASWAMDKENLSFEEFEVL